MSIEADTLKLIRKLNIFGFILWSGRSITADFIFHLARLRKLFIPFRHTVAR